MCLRHRMETPSSSSTDLWFGTDDGDGTGSPAVIHLLHGPKGLKPSDVQVNGDNVEWTYSITVGAGQTVSLANFTVVATSQADAIAAANALVTAADFGGQAAAYLTPVELGSLANFAYNHAPTDVSLTNVTASLNENLNTASAIPLADIVVTDDGQGTNSFALSGPDAAVFEVVGSQLRLKAGTVLNFEAKSSYSVVVNVDDSTVGTSPDVSVAYTLTVNDVNEAPTVVVLQNVVASLPENTSTATVTKVADILVTDDALGTNVLSLSGADAASFQIIGTSLYLKAGVSLNFEANSLYQINVQVDDATVGGTPDAAVAYSLTLIDVNEAPTAVSLQNVVSSLSENTNTSTPIKVADILVADDALGTNVLSLSGANAASFQIIGSALYLKSGVTLNYETQSLYQVNVQVDDPTVGASPDATVLYSLTVLNVNEAPSAVAGGPYSVLEGSTVTLNATGSSDPDAGDTLSYAWDLNYDGVTFDVDATGSQPNVGFNDSFATRSIALRVTDAVGLSSIATSMLTVNNVAPTVSISAPLDGFQGVKGQVRTFALTASDASSVDQAATFTYAVNWGDGSSVSSYTGQPNAANVQHVFSNAGTYSVSVTAMDKDGGVSSATTRSVTILSQELQGNQLAVGGTSGDDTLTVTPVTSTSATVQLNATNLGTVSLPSGGLFFYASTGVDTVILNGTAAADTFTLDASASTVNGVTVRSQSVEATKAFGLAGNDSFNLVGGALTVDGGTGTDVLIGANAPTNWNITATNAGNVAAATFTNVEQITGGNQNDTFFFVGAGGLTGALSGGDGTDSLDYHLSTRAATVNLLTGAATGTGGASQFERFVGSALADTLTSGNGANNWVFDLTNQGTLNNTFRFEGVESVTGGTGNDTYQFLNAGSLTGTLNAGTGVDTLDFSPRTAPVAVNLQTLSASPVQKFASIESLVGTSGIGDLLQGTNANTSWNVTTPNGGTVGSIAFAGFENLTGGIGADKFTFANPLSSISGMLDGGGGIDSLITSNIANEWNLTGLGAGTLNAITSFSNLENLTGGTATDHFLVSGSGGISGALNGGAGVDSLDFSAASGPVSVNLQPTSFATNIGGFSAIESIVGSAASDLLHGLDTNSSWTITGLDTGTSGAVAFSGFENLQGGLGNDLFAFTNSGSIISGTIRGGDGLDTLTGPSVANQWQISDANQGTLTGRAAFFDIENLNGGTAADKFTFADGGEITGTVNGGTGVGDSLDFSTRSGPISIDLRNSSVDGLNKFTGIETLVGTGEQADTLQANNVANAWKLTGAGIGTVGTIAFSSIENLLGGTLADSLTLTTSDSSISGIFDGGLGADTVTAANINNSWALGNVGGGDLNGTLNFLNVENLTGGTLSDTFAFAGLASFGVINGGAGTDSFNYANWDQSVVVNLQTKTASALAAPFVAIETFVGSATSDTLIGSNASTAWTINGSNSGLAGTSAFTSFEQVNGGTGNDTFTLGTGGSLTGSLNGGAGVDTLVGSALENVWNVTGTGQGTLNSQSSFSNIENLTGGAGVDRFSFSATSSVPGALNGGTGNNLLDYSSWSTGVTVNLQTGIATGITGLVSNVIAVIGGSGADNLIGRSAASSILVGGGGSDILTGGNVHDILIGGGGADSLNGGTGDDLLIAGSTAWDTNHAALFALFSEWNSTTHNYATRVGDLLGTLFISPANGSYYLQNTPTDTLFDDSGAVDTLVGSTGQDWFIAASTDLVADRVSSGATAEQVDAP